MYQSLSKQRNSLPNSMDLNLVDFSLWRVLQRKLTDRENEIYHHMTRNVDYQQRILLQCCVQWVGTRIPRTWNIFIISTDWTPRELCAIIERNARVGRRFLWTCTKNKYVVKFKTAALPCIKNWTFLHMYRPSCDNIHELINLKAVVFGPPRVTVHLLCLNKWR